MFLLRGAEDVRTVPCGTELAQAIVSITVPNTFMLDMIMRLVRLDVAMFVPPLPPSYTL